MFISRIVFFDRLNVSSYCLFSHAFACRETHPRLLRVFPAAGAQTLHLPIAALDFVDHGNVWQVCLARASRVGCRGLEAMVVACPRLKELNIEKCKAAARYLPKSAATATARVPSLGKPYLQEN